MALQVTSNEEKTREKLIRVNGPRADSRMDSTYFEFFTKSFPYTSIQLDKPEESWLLCGSQSKIVGHFSLWYSDTPVLDGESTGLIGHFFAADGRSALELLEFATSLLKQKGCKRAVGPVDGSTFRRYRFVTEISDTGPFFMEPANPHSYPEYFIDFGFEKIATYSSTIAEARPSFADETKTGMNSVDGVSLRSLDLTQIELELDKIYRISCSAFERNFLYTPIEKRLFFDRYRSLTAVVNPHLVVIAESQRTPVGYVMTIPDLTGNNKDTAIIKTVARIPDASLKGLGLMLMAESHRRASSMGYKQLIHALYKDDNVSATYSTISGAETIRKYAVFQKHI